MFLGCSIHPSARVHVQSYISVGNGEEQRQVKHQQQNMFSRLLSYCCYPAYNTCWLAACFCAVHRAAN